MMICKADFQDLFPETFPADPEADAKPAARPPNRPGLARWEDEGGRLAPVSASDPVGRLRSRRETVFGPTRGRSRRKAARRQVMPLLEHTGRCLQNLVLRGAVESPPRRLCAAPLCREEQGACAPRLRDSLARIVTRSIC